MSFVLGDFELRRVSGGRLWLDAGTMFGMVPKAVWQRKCTTDDQNRIELETNCLLVQTGGANVLVDTGYGSKWGPRERGYYALQDGNPLLVGLAETGLEPGDIDWVILSHLHFDHAGGCTLRDKSERLRPAFPKARYVVQRREWEDATGDLPELAGAYFEQDFGVLKDTGQLHLVDGEAALLPGVSVRLTGGHTRGHQMVVIESQGRRASYLGDICPTAAHLRSSWIMSYDQCSRDLRRIKPALLREIAEQGGLLAFDHDPDIEAAYLRRDEEGEAVIREAVSL